MGRLELLPAGVSLNCEARPAWSCTQRPLGGHWRSFAVDTDLARREMWVVGAPLARAFVSRRRSEAGNGPDPSPFAVGTKLPFRTLAAGLTLKASAGEMLGRTELIT